MEIIFSEKIGGSKFALFKDLNEQECSLSVSRIETTRAVYFGVDEPEMKIRKRSLTDGSLKNVDFLPPVELKVSSRMLLTQEQVKELLPMLQKFVDTGELR